MAGETAVYQLKFDGSNEVIGNLVLEVDVVNAVEGALIAPFTISVNVLLAGRR